MKITFLNFKLCLGTKVLERILKKENTRNVQSCNIEDAKSMGMLCVIKNENDLKAALFRLNLNYLEEDLWNF